MLDYERGIPGIIAGVDEAGRGPLAGPVSCAAVIMPRDRFIDGVDDSKKLSSAVREELYGLIVAEALAFKVVLIDHGVIDEINILNAVKLGMKQAVEGLHVAPDIVLVDAVKLDIAYPQRSIIRGDTLSYNIAAASILAKVTRDRLMVKYGEKYPQYMFEEHKGYGTKNHIAALKCYGSCELHRKTFITKILSG